ncbi:unnamed protein product [Paramecium sonneborni]|uniref:Uncharacterized protein n=1 Tax=Paramecium sonneborni TaxID=65129 RepID=A0A8S1N3N5_9CILI|nr:unnamed protein product [Paramecium sonneborni]
MDKLLQKEIRNHFQNENYKADVIDIQLKNAKIKWMIGNQEQKKIFLKRNCNYLVNVKTARKQIQQIKVKQQMIQKLKNKNTKQESFFDMISDSSEDQIE